MNREYEYEIDIEHGSFKVPLAPDEWRVSLCNDAALTNVADDYPLPALGHTTAEWLPAFETTTSFTIELYGLTEPATVIQIERLGDSTGSPTEVYRFEITETDLSTISKARIQVSGNAHDGPITARIIEISPL